MRRPPCDSGTDVVDLLTRHGVALVKLDDGTILEREIRHDQADAQEQLTDVVLDFCHDPSGRGPGVLIADTLVANERRAAGPSQ